MKSPVGSFQSGFFVVQIIIVYWYVFNGLPSVSA